MVAVVNPAYAGVVAAEIFCDHPLRAVDENDVVLGEAFFGGGRKTMGPYRAEISAKVL